ncbi:MAG TPA: TVP38/TMEM64 family protein [Candidatus Nanoarchaeia archaeon]|nr:TVP38/TMEM64 family protein [Candidatus Nanoarchaeia archaeon]
MKDIRAAVKIAIAALLVIFAIIMFPTLVQWYARIDEAIRSAGAYGPLLYGAAMIIAILIAPLPASPLAILAGSVFGPWRAMMYTLIAATLGALIAFLLSRYLLRDYFKKYYESSKWYKKLEGKNDMNIAYLIFLTRLMPQVSFDIISYLAGLTRIRILLFTLATFLGMIPIVLVLSFFGHILADYQEIMLIILAALFVIYLVYKILALRMSHFAYK